MTPAERWSALVEFWDRHVQDASSDEEREYAQAEAAFAWRIMEFFEQRPDAGCDLVEGNIRWRSRLPGPAPQQDDRRIG